MRAPPACSSGGATTGCCVSSLQRGASPAISSVVVVVAHVVCACACACRRRAVCAQQMSYSTTTLVSNSPSTPRLCCEYSQVQHKLCLSWVLYVNRACGESGVNLGAKTRPKTLVKTNGSERLSQCLVRSQKDHSVKNNKLFFSLAKDNSLLSHMNNPCCYNTVIWLKR